MKNQTHSIIAMAAMLTGLLSLSGGPALAADSAPMTPEYAARKENHRKQQEQRITTEKRKSAAEALKAEHLKVYKAKQQVKHSNPEATETK
jgi:hypothetical protein